MTTIAERPAGSEPALVVREELRTLLERIRKRTLLLLEPVTEEDAQTQHDLLMSPIVWDVGHISAFEKLWLQDQLDRPVSFGEMPGVYNPFDHPRAERGQLRLPTLAGVKDELARVREATLERLERADFDDGRALLRGGYVYRMVAQHESQHQETILQTLQLKTGAPYAAPRARGLPKPRADVRRGMVRFPDGDVTVGTDDTSAAYDNERPSHTVNVAAFEMDTHPVTNGEYLDFINAGGYRAAEYWSTEGQAWLKSTQARAPQYWRFERGNWRSRMLDRDAPVDPLKPVCHVCYHEADAFARWAGKRLPTEAEWEVAARWDPQSRTAGKFPWGEAEWNPARANLDQLAFDVAPAGTYESGKSPIGCFGMVGDVWEWTSSDFAGYPGFRTFPYEEYSAVFFGSEYKVLRGGSWATAPNVARATSRNWDYPVRRQIFSGFRCARDA